MTADALLAGHDRLLPELEALYTDLHANPELSMQERRTAARLAERLRRDGYEVTAGIGGTGVVGLLRNGDGPVVMLRADMDALPVLEATGLPYASEATGVDGDGRLVPVMHACGHDMHCAWLAGVATLFARGAAAWRGTLMVVFQPGEEIGAGAHAMLDDGLTARFPRPDVILGQHVSALHAGAGVVGYRAGPTMTSADALQVRMFGRGAHGSRPDVAVDPVVMAAAAVVRLQTVVSREVSPDRFAVVTVGSLQAGAKENVIPEDAVLKLSVRTYDDAVRSRVLAAVERIVNAEAAASAAPRPPEITTLSSLPLLRNDPAATATVAAAFAGHFPDGQAREIPPRTASEDFGTFGTAWEVPSVFWFVDGTDPARYAAAEEAGTLDYLPVNHSAAYAPAIHPTLGTGLRAMTVAACAWLTP